MSNLAKSENLRDKVLALQAEIIKLPQIELLTDHCFADGMYCRSLWRPAGTLIVGKIHKKEHFYIVAHGTVQVTIDERVIEIIGPKVIISPIGTKRAVLAITDATCITVHKTDKTILEEVEDDLIEPENCALFDSHNKHIKSKILEVT